MTKKQLKKEIEKLRLNHNKYNKNKINEIPIDDERFDKIYNAFIELFKAFKKGKSYFFAVEINHKSKYRHYELYYITKTGIKKFWIYEYNMLFMSKNNSKNLPYYTFYNYNIHEAFYSLSSFCDLLQKTNVWLINNISVL